VETGNKVETGNREVSAIETAEIARSRPQAAIVWIREDGSRVV